MQFFEICLYLQLQPSGMILYEPVSAEIFGQKALSGSNHLVTDCDQSEQGSISKSIKHQFWCSNYQESKFEFPKQILVFQAQRLMHF